jgi:hypothetical protein
LGTRAPDAQTVFWGKRVHGGPQMSTLAIRLRYRPLRLGWCVEHGDFEAFRRAARLSFTMWGGRFNPVIPINDEKGSNDLVRLFRVDALFPLSDTAEAKAFATGFKHLP